MDGRRTGVWIVGVRGSIAATLIIGALAVRKGIAGLTGMVTARDVFDPMQLVPVSDLEFGGCDVRGGDFREIFHYLSKETEAVDEGFWDQIREDLLRVEEHVRSGTVRNCGKAIEGMAAASLVKCESVRKEIEQVRESVRLFKERLGLHEVVVVNLASTEPALELQELHGDLCEFDAQLDTDGDSLVKASTIYAYAAIQEGCPYINFTPSNAALFPAMIQLAEKKGVPVMGNDGKTGETLVKSALAPMFSCRNLEVLSWEGFNILGNMDGRILDNADNRASKLKTKDGVISRILGYTPHSKVHIDFVPSLEDRKTAWDFIHFEGFLGAKMSLQFVWQGYDSILAAPLVLDLVRLAEYAKRRGESGLMPHLASYFKAPLGVEEHNLHEQYRMLVEYAMERNLESF